MEVGVVVGTGGAVHEIRKQCNASEMTFNMIK